MSLIWLMLTLASSGTFLHTGLKLPYFTFFGERHVERAEELGKEARPREPPWNMLLAMAFLASLCILIGVYPNILYRILPYPVEFQPYSAQHVVETMQILLFTALGFFLLLRHLAGEPTISLDTDWFYRKGARLFLRFIYGPLAALGMITEKAFFEKLPSLALLFVNRWDRFDLEVVDGVVNGISSLAIISSKGVRSLQRGDTQGYVSVFMAGIAVLLILIWLITGGKLI
jgi:multicomponent Na+:H+ antiporter subunit D